MSCLLRRHQAEQLVTESLAQRTMSQTGDTLATVPIDIFSLILSFLDNAKDLSALASVSKAFTAEKKKDLINTAQVMALFVKGINVKALQADQTIKNKVDKPTLDFIYSHKTLAVKLLTTAPGIAFLTGLAPNQPVNKIVEKGIKWIEWMKAGSPDPVPTDDEKTKKALHSKIDGALMDSADKAFSELGVSNAQLEAAAKKLPDWAFEDF